MKSGDPTSLRYACLEMRYCIEAICYDKAKLYRKHFPNDILEKWQPRKPIDALIEFDPYANENYSMRIWSEKPDGSKDKLIFSGAHKVLPTVVLIKHYDKLGSYLHVPTVLIEKDQGSLEAYNELKDYLGQIVAQITETVNNTFDSNAALTVSAKCQECGQFLIRHAESLKTSPIVKCTNPQCQAEYDVQIDHDGSIWKLRTIDVECPECKTKFYFSSHLLGEGKAIECANCSQKYIIGMQWILIKVESIRT